jgi:hypothetical protein
MEQHLTLSEAQEFTGKSASTIKRMIAKVTADPQHPDRAHVLPSPEEVARRKAAKEPYAWKVNRDLLLRWFRPATAASGAKPGASPEGDAQAEIVIQVLREQLQSKDEQIATLSKQLDRKDEQITALNDRQREFNVLMGQLQQRLAITPPKAETESVVEPTTTNTPPKDSSTAPKKKKTAKAKRGLFGFFRQST